MQKGSIGCICTQFESILALKIIKSNITKPFLKLTSNPIYSYAEITLNI
jgi:hypothetical protein